MRLVIALGLALMLAGCREHSEEHDHGHSHAQPGEGPEPLSITRWTEAHELFVELDPPKPLTEVSYHAHVTRLDGFAAVTVGRFTVRFRDGERIAAETSIDGVARPGIFTPRGAAPPAGRYQLEMVYEHETERAAFDCGEVVVANEAPAADSGVDAALSFLKEQQWRIPFGTAFVTRRPMAREIELPATLESASGDQLTISSPTSGRFFHAKDRTLAEGLVLTVGEVIGSIAPTVAGDDFSRLQLAVDEAFLEQQRIDQELKRVAPLVEKGLLPDKRLAALESDRAVATARSQAARRRLGQVTSPGGEGGLPVRVTKIGVLSKVLVDNGAPVEPGEPLVRLAGTGPLWAKARFVARPSVELAGGVPVALRLAGSERIDLGSEARFVSALPVVDERSQLASWTAELGLTVGEELKPGLASVLIVRLGAPKERLAVIESAVVEINTRAYVFVQTGGESFEKRRVVLGVRDGGFVEVLTGVDPGERAVTQGGFDIHLASVMGTVESHRH